MIWVMDNGGKISLYANKNSGRGVFKEGPLGRILVGLQCQFLLLPPPTASEKRGYINTMFPPRRRRPII